MHEGKGQRPPIEDPVIAAAFVERALSKRPFWRCAGEECLPTEGSIPRELPLTIFVDGQEWVTVLCSPHDLTALVIGFLCSAGLVAKLEEIEYLRVCADDEMADVRLTTSPSLPAKRVLTTGCGGGRGFEVPSTLSPVGGSLVLDSAQVSAVAKLLAQGTQLYRMSGGLHAAALCDPERLLALAEDIGRHNTIDRILGQCLLADIKMRDRIVVTSGRISSEMVIKVAQMAIPVAVSMTSPTDRAIMLAEEAGITLVGYARGGRFSVYSHPRRIRDCSVSEATCL